MRPVPTPVVAGWQSFLEGVLIRLEDYLVPGQPGHIPVGRTRRKGFFRGACRQRRRAIHPTVCAVFIPPERSARQMFYGLDSGPAPARLATDAGIVLAMPSAATYAIVLNTLFAMPPYAAGIDVYEEGRLIAGYSYASVSECRDNLSQRHEHLFKSPQLRLPA
ncbi:MAG: hypothetical protein MZV70_41090 [Desulfobacterales bacterium]|nr:hypothetical protein [Desulfobacterales bacterium]